MLKSLLEKNQKSQNKTSSIFDDEDGSDGISEEEKQVKRLFYSFQFRPWKKLISF